MPSLYFAVFVGGATGGISRELLVPWITLPGAMTSTLVINLVACLALGWLGAVRHRLSEHVTHLAAIGFCGGMSTFSSFVADITTLGATSGVALASIAIFAEVLAGLVAAAFGLAIGRAVHGERAA